MRTIKQLMVRVSAALLLLFASGGFASSQVFIEAGVTVDACGGTFSDGTTPYPAVDYLGSNAFTLCPDVPGDVISLEFVAFLLQTNANPNNSDYLIIYDGPDINSPSLGSYTGSALQGSAVTATITNTSGCLTFEFVDGGPDNVNAAGWEATIVCTTPCSNPTAASSIVDPIPSDPSVQTVGVCMGEAVVFGDAGSMPDAGFALSEWEWNFDDGTVVTEPSNANVSHTYSAPGEYIVNLTVFDDNGCPSYNLTPLQVLVSTVPIFNSAVDETVCVDSPADLFGDPIQSISWTALPPQVDAPQTILGTDAGFSYTSCVTIDFFDDNQTLDNCADFLSVDVNMEHSYMGDLDLIVECPDGTQVFLLEYPNGGGATYFGEPVDVDASTTLGTGYDYSWSQNAASGVTAPNGPTVNTAYTDNDGDAATGNILVAGEYLPTGDLCDFVGCPLNGTWCFTVVDNLNSDGGALFEWGLNFDPSLYPDVTTFTPVITGADWQPSSGNSANPGITDISPDGLNATASFDTPGFYDYEFVVENDFGCSFDTTVTIEVITGPTSNISAGPDQVFCGTPVTLQGEFITSSPSPCSAASTTETVCYGNSENLVYTYCPDVPGDGTMMTIDIYAGAIEGFNWDNIFVYDGDNTGAPELISLTGSYGDTQVMATNPDGCLTLQITSDGWNSCATPGFGAPPQPIVWCAGCGQGTCGFTWTWEPAEYLDNPNTTQPTVLDFDGNPTEYTVFVEPIGFENCAATDVVMVVPGFEYTTSYSDPTCLITDGEIVLNITEPASEGPWDVQLSDLTGVLDQQSFGGGILVFDNLEAGNYSLEVSDQNGCTYTSDFVLADPLPPGITVSPDEVICIGGATTLTASAATGGPYVFNWSVNGTPVGQGASLLVGPDATTVYDVQGVDAAGCITQSGSVQVGIYDAFTIDIDAEDLICLGDEVLLSAINVTGGEGNGYSFAFDYEGTTFASGLDDQVQFVPPLTGDFCVTVTEACSTPPATACVEVEVEQPYDLTLAADTTRGCVPQALGFTHSIPDVFVESQLWDFGDGGEGSLYEQVHVYDDPGVYDVALTVVTTTGCVNSTIANNYIQIFSPPSVGFTAGPQPTTAPDTRIDFDSDVSPTVTDWSWVFLPNVPEAVSSEPNPTYTFPMGNGGIYPVTLAVTDTNGCESQVTRNVEIYDFFNVYIPSAFTPNNDGFNDLWTVYGSDIDPDRFELSIFNRWGERVFHTTDIDRGWLGQADDEVVDPAQQYFSGDGTYVYRVVFYSESTNEKREVRGYINLTR